MDNCPLPRKVQHLAWLDMNEDSGLEYWIAMNLAGDYAVACHDVIHKNISREIGLKSICRIENHHNFAWRELDEEGKSMIVHRKGATPAHQGELGIIPGSMTEPGYIVSGLGSTSSINSASHGAGRKWSRSKARSKTTKSELNKILRSSSVSLMGGGVDESPLAYKNIHDVINFQKSLIRVEGKFYPRIVRMAKD